MWVISNVKEEGGAIRKLCVVGRGVARFFVGNCSGKHRINYGAVMAASK